VGEDFEGLDVGGGFAFRLGGGFDFGCGGWACFRCGCGDHFYCAPKPAHVFGKLTRRWDQPVVVAPIGSPEEAIKSKLRLDWAGSAMELVQRPRAAAANKGNFGHVLVVGGSVGRSGAPSMTSLGRCGQGPDW